MQLRMQGFTPRHAAVVYTHAEIISQRNKLLCEAIYSRRQTVNIKLCDAIATQQHTIV